MTAQEMNQEQLTQTHPDTGNGDGRFGVVFRRVRDVWNGLRHRNGVDKEVLEELWDEDAWASERAGEIWKLVEERFKEDPRLEFVGDDFRQVKEWVLGEEGESSGMVIADREVMSYSMDLSYRPKFYQECEDRNGLEFSQRYELYKDVWDMLDPEGEFVDFNYARKKGVSEEWMEIFARVLDVVEEKLKEHEMAKVKWMKPRRKTFVKNEDGVTPMTPKRSAVHRVKNSPPIVEEPGETKPYGESPSVIIPTPSNSLGE